jgi:hypothetical protein
VKAKNCPVTITEPAIMAITKNSGGYPYFVQFLCREIYDSYLQQRASGVMDPVVTVAQVVRKLDTDFFAGRWNRVTDRQRELLSVVAMLENCDDEFSVSEIVAKSKESGLKPFSSSHVNQMLSTLSENGLVYKNRYGKYAFAAPLLGEFIRRQQATLS